MKQLVLRVSAAVAAIPLSVAILSGCGSGGGGASINTEVSGTVLDSTNDDAPVAGATVVIGGKSSTTDSTGTFDIRDAAVGINKATVTPPGSGATAQQIAFYPPVQPLPAEVVTLYLYLGQIIGIVDLNKQPVSGAIVVDTETGTQTTTESDGTFLIPGLAPGTPDTVDIVDGTANAQVTGTPPAGGGVYDAGTINLTTSSLTSNPPGIPSPTLTGSITLSDTGGPGIGATVILFRKGAEVDSLVTGSSGTFGFYAPPGPNYTIEVELSSYQTYVSPTFFTVTVTSAGVGTALPAISLTPN
jgi:hypothetical protein